MLEMIMAAKKEPLLVLWKECKMAEMMEVYLGVKKEVMLGYWKEYLME